MTPAEIRCARESLGLTQKGFGLALGGYSLRAVQFWEAGQRVPDKAVMPLLKRLLADSLP